jgi:hypothetical protein
MVKRKKTLKEDIPFTENGVSYFKFKSFWNFLQRSKSWNIKYEATMRMLETLFGAKEEISNLEGKNTRHLIIKQLEIDKPIVRKDKIKDVPFN